MAGPSSGGPSSGGPSSGGPSSGGPSSGGPSSGGPSSGGPSSGGPSSDPPVTAISKTKKKRKSKSRSGTQSSAEIFAFLNRIYPVVNRVCKGLNILFVRTYKRKFVSSTPEQLLHSLVDNALQGQLDYLALQIKAIKLGKDPLSQSLDKHSTNGKRKGNVNKYEVSDYGYSRLREIIKTERRAFRKSDVDLKSELFSALKTHDDHRLQSRTAFWVLLMTGLEFKNLQQQLDDSEFLPQIISPLLNSIDVFQRFLGFFLVFIYNYYLGFEQYFMNCNILSSMPNHTKTGYNLANWVRYRYGITRFEYITVDRFLPYFFRTFGYVHGRVPVERKQAYRAAVHSAFTQTVAFIGKFDNITVNIPQSDFAGILEYFAKMLENELIVQEIDVLGNVINQPAYYYKATDIVHWLQQLHMHVKSFSDISYFKVNRKEYTLDLDMFEVILPGIRNVNEKGESVLIPWF